MNFFTKMQQLVTKLNLLPKKALASKRLNGVGAFVPSICRLTLQVPTSHTCPLFSWIQQHLHSFSKSRPYVHIRITPGSPLITAEYNDNTCISEKPSRNIHQLINRLCDRHGNLGKSRMNHVEWDPFHHNKFTP